MGGTLDISTFYENLRHMACCTFNIAVDLRTTLRVFPYDIRKIKVSSKGFEIAEFRSGKVPLNHPLRLIFAIAEYFNIEGVHIYIESASPPKSGLGGSSAMAVALVYAFSQILKGQKSRNFSLKDIVLLTHSIEEKVVGEPCGLQDHLSAVFGGFNLWHWPQKPGGPPFVQETLIKRDVFDDFKKHILLTYCGVSHKSKELNNKCIRQFSSKKDMWVKIANLTRPFAKAVSSKDFYNAAVIMNEETALRHKITPELLNDVGNGCIWALGTKEDIIKLKKTWREILLDYSNAYIMEVNIANTGVDLMN